MKRRLNRKTNQWKMKKMASHKKRSETVCDYENNLVKSVWIEQQRV